MPADWKTKLQFEDTATFDMGFNDEDSFNMRMSEITRVFDGRILTDTTTGWNSLVGLIAEKNTIYVYSDYKIDEHGNNVAGLKIGDGLAYLIDIPFIDTIAMEHMANTDIHVTLLEKAFWNNKVRGIIAENDEERLVLTTH